MEVGGVSPPPPFSLHGLAINLSLPQTPTFWFVWPHCVMGTHNTVRATKGPYCLGVTCKSLLRAERVSSAHEVHWRLYLTLISLAALQWGLLPLVGALSHVPNHLRRMRPPGTRVGQGLLPSMGTQSVFPAGDWTGAGFPGVLSPRP